jgi:hypothetical protein
VAKYVVDCGVVLRLVADDVKAPAKHKLLAPTLLRSQALSGTPSCDATPGRSGELGWPETYAAEYMALTQLQGDAFITLDRKLARAVGDLVPVAGIEALA